MSNTGVLVPITVLEISVYMMRRKHLTVQIQMWHQHDITTPDVIPPQPAKPILFLKSNPSIKLWDRFEPRCTAGNQEQEQSSIISTCRCQRTRFPPCRNHSEHRETSRVPPTCQLNGSPEGNLIHSESWEENHQQRSNKQINNSISNIDIIDWAPAPRWWMLDLFAPRFACSKQSLQADLSHQQQHFSVQTFPLQSKTYSSYKAWGGFPLNACWECRRWIMQREIDW